MVYGESPKRLSQKRLSFQIGQSLKRPGQRRRNSGNGPNQNERSIHSLVFHISTAASNASWHLVRKTPCGTLFLFTASPKPLQYHINLWLLRQRCGLLLQAQELLRSDFCWSTYCSKGCKPPPKQQKTLDRLVPKRFDSSLPKWCVPRRTFSLSNAIGAASQCPSKTPVGFLYDAPYPHMCPTLRCTQLKESNRFREGWCHKRLPFGFSMAHGIFARWQAAAISLDISAQRLPKMIFLRSCGRLRASGCPRINLPTRRNGPPGEPPRPRRAKEKLEHGVPMQTPAAFPSAIFFSKSLTTLRLRRLIFKPRRMSNSNALLPFFRIALQTRPLPEKVPKK